MVHGPGHRDLPEKTKVMGRKCMKQGTLYIAMDTRKGESAN